MNTNEAIEEKTPLDYLIEQEDLDIPYDDRLYLINFMKSTLQWILDQEAKKPETVILGVLYALGDLPTVELSQRKRAKDIGCSHGTISKYTARYNKEFNLQ